MSVTTGGVVVSSQDTLPRSADEAVTALYRIHAAGLRRVASLLVDDRETAEDVVQDAFVKLHRRWLLLRDPDKALAYLRTSVVNGSRSRLRRRRTERAFVEPLAADHPSAEHTVLRAADLQAVGDGLAALPRRQREVLVLRYYLDLSEAEIAGSLGISRGSVKSHAARGIAALAARMEAVA
jgi:RNA polymerase sigma-70 factor (sigma-E family)